MKTTFCKKIVLILACIAALLAAALLAAGLNAPAAASVPGENIVAVAQTADEEAPQTQAEDSAAAAEEGDTGWKAIAAGIAIGLAAAAGAIGMGIAIAKTNESIARQPEADGKLRSTFMLGLIFIETAIIYALVVAILIIFVL